MLTLDYNKAYNLITEDQESFWTTASVTRSLIGRGLLAKSSPVDNYVYIYVNSKGEATVEATEKFKRQDMKS